MKEILKEIQVRLGEQVETLKYIDVDWGQMETESPPVKYPCAIIDFSGAEFTDEGNQTQRGIARIDILLCDIALSNSNLKAPDNQRAKALGIFDLMSSVNAALHGWNPGNLADPGPLTRTGVRKIKRNDGIRSYIMSYKMQYVDNSAAIVYPTHPQPVPYVSLTLY